jgi:Family of unknown function (DUF6624)
MLDTLKEQLLRMIAADRRVRAKLVARGKLFEGYAPLMAEVHDRNAQALEAIVREHGWPGRSLVGEEGANAAWLVLQHAIGHPALQRACLPLLRQAAADGEVGAAQPAYLEDRIRVFEGRPQRYGTQLDWDERGELSPCPLEDPERVDALRASVGLGPLAERTAEARRQAAAEGERPTDFRKRAQAKAAWAKAVGWIDTVPGASD